MKKISSILISLFSCLSSLAPTSVNSQTWLCGSSFTDSRDGKVYNTILIGNQCWMQQNLNYGSRINGNRQQVDRTPEKYCYNDLDTNCSIYGGLYQWGELVQFYNGASDSTVWKSGSPDSLQGLCPSGWWIPTDQNWCTLLTYLDNTVSCGSLGLSGTSAGGKLKEKGTIHWLTPNTGATNSSMYFGLPAGGRLTNGTFSGLYNQAGFWTLTESSSSTGYSWGLGYNTARMNKSSASKATGISVRCFKNCTSPSNVVPGTNTAGPNQIIWMWNKVNGAFGYRWGKINVFDSALDIGSDTSYTDTGLSCNTSYNRYVWAYNNCNYSSPTLLSQTTTIDPLMPLMQEIVSLLGQKYYGYGIR